MEAVAARAGKDQGRATRDAGRGRPQYPAPNRAEAKAEEEPPQGCRLGFRGWHLPIRVGPRPFELTGKVDTNITFEIEKQAYFIFKKCMAEKGYPLS
jgi:hypothetical protein